MSEQYREISFTRRLESGDDPYEADMRVVFDDNGRSYRLIVSRVDPRVTTPVLMEGDAKLYERRLMNEKRIMADYDDKNRAGRPVVKPAPSARQEPCPACHGSGEAPDKHGNWTACGQCGGIG